MAKLGFDDSKFVPYDRRPQTFSGVEVILRQPAQMPHPHPSQLGRLTPTRGVTHVLLKNEHEFYECDYNCGFTNELATSVKAHLTSHNPNKHAPDYDSEVLRQIIRIAADERQRSVRGYAQRTAERLNASTIKTYSGNPWTSGAVSNLWSYYGEKYAPRRPGRPRGSGSVEATTAADATRRIAAASRPTSAPPAPAAADPAATSGDSRKLRRAADLAVIAESAAVSDPVAALGVLLGAAEEIVANARRVLAQVRSAEPDPEVARKAQMYDEMRRMLGGGGK